MEMNTPIEITVKEPGLIWDLSDAQTERINEQYSKRLLIEIAETAVRLAKLSGASQEDVDTLTLLINDAAR